MTESDITELKELLELYRKADLFSGIMIGILLVVILAITIYEIWKIKKLKKWRNEYKATLTNEQLEKIEEIKKFDI